MNSASMFRKVSRSLLMEVATGNVRHPTLYGHFNPILREGFWWRLREIDRQMALLKLHGGRCLDVGGGEGVFLPTLAARFDKVVCVDLDTGGAKRLVERLSLNNAELTEGLFEQSVFEAPFDSIVAADVLEHYRELTEPLAAIRRWLKPGGYLFTSLPTESLAYRGLRKLFGVTKPSDHYRTAAEVEFILAENRFVPVLRRKLPLPGLSLFTLTAWNWRG